MEGSGMTIQETKECRPTQIESNTNSTENNRQQKLQQKNTRSRSVTIQLPGDRGKKNKGSRSDNTPSHINSPNDPISTIPDIQELRSVDNSSTPQRMASVAGHPKNRLYIDSDASLHILFNKKLMGELNDIEVPLKIQAGGKLFHIKQIGFLHQVLRHLPLAVSAYHYSETAIANLLSFAKFANEYYIICNTRIDDAI